MILDAIRWFGIEWDEGPDKGGEYGPYKQSERLAHYQKWAKELVSKGHAYYCFCSSERLAELRKKQTENKTIGVGLEYLSSPPPPPPYSIFCASNGKPSLLL